LLNSIDIAIPKDENEQRAIASVLSSLDAKIDFLHRQNKTLEAMAETLFRQWFVEPCKNGLPEGWRRGKWVKLLKFNLVLLSNQKHLQKLENTD
jgi:type I restriction enzyme S subunit